ncbi:MAG TPA: ABC transporter permease [Gemmatimonadaceae bacterium]
MLGRQVVHALRSLRRARGFSVLAVATLGLGIGANSAIFSLVDAALLRRLPYGNGTRIVHVQHASSQFGDARFSIPEIADLRAQSHAFDAVVEYHSMAFQLYGHGDPQRVQTGVVSDNFFQVLGVRPLQGRLFEPGEEAVGAPPVVLLSYKYWVNVMGSDPHAVGSTFIMNDKVHTVVGILPPLPTYPNDNDIWMPAGACPFRSAPAAMASRTARLPTVFARLKPGVTLAQARSDVATIDDRMRIDHPEAYPASANLRSTVTPIDTEMTATSRPVLALLFGTAVFLLIAAAANFASLTMARQARRARELATREALGSGAWRLYGQLASESLILTLGGGAVGLILAQASVGVLRMLAQQFSPRGAEVALHPAVFAYTVAICVGVGLLAASAPFVRRSRGAQIIDRLRQGNSGAMGTPAEGRMRRAFVAAQVAVAFTLLIGAGLVSRSLLKLEAVDAGIDPASVVTARLAQNFTKYPTNALLRGFGDRILANLHQIHGAEAVAIANTFPLNGSVTGTLGFAINGQANDSGSTAPKADVTAVSPEYFSALGIPLVRGRLFTDADRDTLRPPLIVSRRLVTRFWRGRDPIGTTVSFDNGKTWNPIVGVVGDVRQNGLDADVTDEVYVPAAASPPADIRILVRASGPAAAIVPQIRNAVWRVDDHEPVSNVSTLEDVRGAELLGPRLGSAIVGSFSVLALVLAAAGLAGVVGYTVSQRIPEIAIRLALGADSRHILSLVTRDGMGSVAAGVAAGAVASLVLGRFVRGLLFGVQPGDPATYAAVLGVLLVVGLAACLAPARRALRADPARAMRAS